jgi:hypothetical protein
MEGARELQAGQADGLLDRDRSRRVIIELELSLDQSRKINHLIAGHGLG